MTTQRQHPKPAVQLGSAINELNTELVAWAMKHRISADAVHELKHILDRPMETNPLTGDPRSEFHNQQLIRTMASARENTYLWRNNVGAYKTDKGTQLRYGLCNESAKVNRMYKSSDLIGITPVLITEELVGTRVGVFTAIEVKKSVWQPGASSEARKHERAQLRFINAVRNAGGIGLFMNNPLQCDALYNRLGVPHARSYRKRTSK